MAAPNFSYERSLWQRGFRVIAGVDEVGRGAWAGPIVAGAVVFAPAPQIKNSKLKMQNGITINDSKKLKPVAREKAADWIKQNSVSWGIGEVGASVINRLGMARATKMAFRRAIADCNERLEMRRGFRSEKWGNRFTSHNSHPNPQPTSHPHFKIDFLLIDAFYIPFVRGLRRRNQKPIIHGDQKSLSVAAASIIAKVYRDKLMKSLSKKAKFKKYGWGKSKGYGTKEQQKAILRYGLTRLHRKAFVATWRKRQTTQNNTQNNA